MSDNAATPGPSTDEDRRGQGSKQKKMSNFKKKKNRSYQQQLGDSLKLKLGAIMIPGLCNLINPVVRAQPIPISFIGLACICDNVWRYMRICGGRRFATLDTPQYRASFFQVCHYAALAKMIFAQRSSNTALRFRLLEIEKINYVHLKLILTYTSHIPFPIAMYLDSIGKFMIEGQTVIPILRTGDFDVTYDISVVTEWILDAGYRPYNQLNERLVACVNTHLGLDLAAWEIIPDPNNPNNQVFRASQALRNIYGQAGFEAALAHFSEICSSVSHLSGATSVGNFLSKVDLSAGVGTPTQAVRFPGDAIDGDIAAYTTIRIDDYDMQVAGCFLLGYDDRALRRSRFVTDAESTYNEWTVNVQQSIQTIVWSGYRAAE